VLRKREAYRRAFDRFDPARVARFRARASRHCCGTRASSGTGRRWRRRWENAKAFLEVQREHGSFDAFAWSFVGGKPIRRRPRTLKEIPATTPESDAFSKALRARGFRFVGSTICYAFMQGCGLVDDHVQGCFLAKRR
jgi:DNA-3-methyladenine glycosylase I